MIENASRIPEKPHVLPKNPCFSSGPCKKYPGWTLSDLNTDHLGRSHRAPDPKLHIEEAIKRSHTLLDLPEDWKLGIVPGSDTGAFEMAMWSLLGKHPVDALVWENFSQEWATDLASLALPQLTIFKADYGDLPDLTQVNTDHDIVMVYNGTTSGVRVPNLDWISTKREGLVLVDATSAAYAMPIDFSKCDVVTWSWQKVLGGEAAHGMLALSPRAVERLENFTPKHALPKVFRLTKHNDTNTKNTLNEGIFKGSTINTPSMLAIADLHAALDWADSIGGLNALWKRTQTNVECIENWVKKTDWIDWLATDPATRSPTSMCLKIINPDFIKLEQPQQQQAIIKMIGWLEEESAALDIANYLSAPAGFRIWGGATIDVEDLSTLTLWLDWAFARYQQQS